MNAILENSGGPGSSITLDPEIVSLRNKYLKALDGKPFDEMNLLIQKQLETEEDDIKRLSLLAARVYILRLRTLELRNEPTENAMPWSENKASKDAKNKKEGEATGEGAQNKGDDWRRLRMIEAGEVNGVRFPPGIIIDVNKDDGEKLVASNKAEFVETPDAKVDEQAKQADSGEKSQDDAESDAAEPTESEASDEKPQDEAKSDAAEPAESEASNEKPQDDAKSNAAEPDESEASDENPQDDAKGNDFEELSNSAKDESKKNEEAKDK